MTIDALIHWLAGLVAWVSLGLLMWGIWRGVERVPGRAVGAGAGWLRSAFLYLFGLAAFLLLSWLGWRPLLVAVPPGWQTLLLVLGVLLYFPGMALMLWGRLALGRMYFVSTSFGAQLFAGHELVTRGPFALVRHPMYLGLIAAAVGGLLIYQTWTALAYAVFAPAVLLRARREEQALALEFGESWQQYCRRVPALLPRWKSGRHSGEKAGLSL